MTTTRRRKSLPKFREKIYLNCSWCKIGFLRDRYTHDRRMKHPASKGELTFCSKACQGKWLGHKHGYGRPRE